MPALFAYDGVGRRVITGLKYGNQRGVVPVLAAALVSLVPAGAVTVTWSPTTPARRVRRGFDQAEILAHALAGALGVPCRPLLARVDRRAQTGRSRSARRADGPVFRVTGQPPPGLTVVVDDVVTTGATLRRAVDALLTAGCPAVAPVAVAATPSLRLRRVTAPPSRPAKGPPDPSSGGSSRRFLPWAAEPSGTRDGGDGHPGPRRGSVVSR